MHDKVEVVQVFAWYWALLISLGAVALGAGLGWLLSWFLRNF